MPEQTLVLREKAAEVSQLLVDRLSGLGSQRPEEIFRSELGRLTNNLANRLSDLGRREEALEKAQQALSIREQFAQARPDAFLPNLARSISVSRDCLRALDRLSEAATAGETALRLLTLGGIEEGTRSAQTERMYTAEEIRERIRQWASSSSD